VLRKGFAVSSALGKLRLFRAVREDKAVSLLHIAILAAAGAEATLAATSFLRVCFANFCRFHWKVFHATASLPSHEAE